MSKISELLTRAIAKEGTHTGYWKKLKFWTGLESPEFVGGEDPTPKIQDILNSLSPADLSDPEIRALAAAAGNFIWGEKTYQLPEADKIIIAEKINHGEPLTDAELVYYTTSIVDTDMF